jgi:hypothetical protein
MDLIYQSILLHRYIAINIPDFLRRLNYKQNLEKELTRKSDVVVTVGGEANLAFICSAYLGDGLLLLCVGISWSLRLEL